jgi:hypothetical protein
MSLILVIRCELSNLLRLGEQDMFPGLPFAVVLGLTLMYVTFGAIQFIRPS